MQIFMTLHYIMLVIVKINLYVMLFCIKFFNVCVRCSGHLILLENPQRSSDLISGFLAVTAACVS